MRHNQLWQGGWEILLALSFFLLSRCFIGGATLSQVQILTQNYSTHCNKPIFLTAYHRPGGQGLLPSGQKWYPI